MNDHSLPDEVPETPPELTGAVSADRTVVSGTDSASAAAPAGGVAQNTAGEQAASNWTLDVPSYDEAVSGTDIRVNDEFEVQLPLQKTVQKRKHIDLGETPVKGSDLTTSADAAKDERIQGTPSEAERSRWKVEQQDVARKRRKVVEEVATRSEDENSINRVEYDPETADSKDVQRLLDEMSERIKSAIDEAKAWFDDELAEVRRQRKLKRESQARQDRN